MSAPSVADSSELPSLEQSLELVRRARGGDRVALGELLTRYQDRLRRIIQIRLGPRLQGQIESMDIVQNAFVVAIRRLEDIELRDRASVLKWLTRVATHQLNDAVDHFGAQKRAGVTHRDIDRSSSGDRRRLEPSAADTPPDQAAAQNEFRALLDEAVAALPERAREVVLLRDYHDGEWEFVAREIGAPSIEAAQRAYHRAWARLRETLAPYLDDASD
jgi:RNA polymerase sigma-70 factor (ECF subfamily)